jgi:NADH:ubiquinone oxidoreductase subunit 6 (subunit J)
MATFWEKVKKYPCISAIVLFVFLVMTARVQGDIATMFERTLVNLVSGVVIATLILYTFLYLTGSLNPGDKAITDFKQLGKKVLNGKSGDESH